MDERGRLRLAAGGLALSGLAFLVVAYTKRNPAFQEFFVVRAGAPLNGHKWFHPGVPYLWLGLAIATLGAAVAIALSARRSQHTGRLATTLGLSALPCLVLAFTLNQEPTVEGAYFNRSVGAPAGGTVFKGSWFHPFEPRNPYLWLGLALGLLLACVIVCGAAALGERRRASIAPT